MEYSRIRLAVPGPMIPPVPAILLSVYGKSGDPAEISVGWTFVANGNPPQIGVTFDRKHVIHELLLTHKEFVLNLPTVAMVDGFDTVDMNSYSTRNKFKIAGFTEGRAHSVNAPTIVESPLHLECRTFKTVDLPPSRTVFFADVIATMVHSEICDDTGRLLVEKVNFFGMTPGSGEFYTMGEKIGHIGKTVNRTDIKY